MPVMMPWITRLGFGAEILIDRDAEPGRLIDRHQHEHRQDRQAREFETRPAFLETDQGAREKRRSEPDVCGAVGSGTSYRGWEACPSKPSSAPLRCSRPGLSIGRVPEEERA